MQRVVIAICFVVYLATSTARAAEIEGVEFADRYAWAGEELRLNGVGLLRYRILFNGYVAALYLGKRVSSELVLDDVPRRIEIEYFWPIRADDFARVTIEGIQNQVDAETFERLSGQIERLNRSYQDVDAGDRYSLTYVPGIGTEFALNGEALDLIEGAEFSSALFGIWLGDQPFDASLREQLLNPR
jgi:hypothetical protein